MGILYQAADPLYWVIDCSFCLRSYGVQRVGTHVAVGRHRAVRVVPIVLTVSRVAHHGGSRQRVTARAVVQLGEDIFGTCRLLGLHGAALREVARRGRHDAPPVREALGAVLSAAHPGRQHRRGRRSRLPGVQLRPVARRRGREPVDYVGSLEHQERIAGILNIVTICDWSGIFISKDYIEGHDLARRSGRGSSLTTCGTSPIHYNCISDHSAYAGLALLLACTIPTFFLTIFGLQHRAQTGAVDRVRMTFRSSPMCWRPFPPRTTLRRSSRSSFLALASNVALAAYQFR